jgi:hypothetical protein
MAAVNESATILEAAPSYQAAETGYEMSAVTTEAVTESLMQPQA